MIKTVITLLTIGGATLLATGLKLGTPRSGSAYIQKMAERSYRNSGRRSFHGGGTGYGK